VHYYSFAVASSGFATTSAKPPSSRTNVLGTKVPLTIRRTGRKFAFAGS